MNSLEYKSTDDHETIKKWTEERYGSPAMLEGVADKSKAGEMLRIDFPGQVDESLKDLPWDVFFRIFDENNLNFVYEEKTADGNLSKFCKFVPKEQRVEDRRHIL